MRRFGINCFRLSPEFGIFRKIKKRSQFLFGFRLNTNQSHAYEDPSAKRSKPINLDSKQQRPNLLHILLSAPDEWLVPI